MHVVYQAAEHSGHVHVLSFKAGAAMIWLMCRHYEYRNYQYGRALDPSLRLLKLRRGYRLQKGNDRLQILENNFRSPVQPHRPKASPMETPDQPANPQQRKSQATSFSTVRESLK